MEMMERLVDVLGSRAYLGQSSKFECTTAVFKHSAVDLGREVFQMPIKGITCLKLAERAMYSASVVDKAVIVCILDAQVIGALAKETIEPDLDLDVMGSTWASG